jgi:hypothetical protein
MNGAEITSSPVSPTGTLALGGWGLRVGAENYRSQRAGGWFDELRVDTVARSADWLKLSFQNQQATQTFVVQGPATPNPYRAMGFQR